MPCRAAEPAAARYYPPLPPYQEQLGGHEGVGARLPGVGQLLQVALAAGAVGETGGKSVECSFFLAEVCGGQPQLAPFEARRVLHAGRVQPCAAGAATR